MSALLIPLLLLSVIACAKWYAARKESQQHKTQARDWMRLYFASLYPRSSASVQLDGWRSFYAEGVDALIQAAAQEGR